MSDVKRWAVCTPLHLIAGLMMGDVGEEEKGKYVLHSDYAALEARCKQAEKDRDELRAALRFELQHVDPNDIPHDIVDVLEAVMDQCWDHDLKWYDPMGSSSYFDALECLVKCGRLIRACDGTDVTARYRRKP